MSQNKKNCTNKLSITRRLRVWIETILNSNKTIYIILFFAYFHAILRVPFIHALTFFRILIPLSVLIIGKHSLKMLRLLVFSIGGLVALSSIQGFLCQKFYYPDLEFDIGNMVEFWIHYASLLVLVALLVTLWRKEGKGFYKKFCSFNSIIIECAMVCNAIWLLAGGFFEDFSLFGNINNFGCAMVAGVALILCSESKPYWKWIWTVMAAILLYANDSKFALLGLVLELGIYLIIWAEKNVIRKKSTTKHAIIRCVLANWRGICFAAVSIILILVILSPIQINGNHIRGMAIGALKQIFSGHYYEHSNSSLQFRTNAVIGLGDTLKNSYLSGVGVGNSGLILRQILPDMNVLYENESFVSSHVWWLELFSDFGLIVIIPSILIFVSQLSCFFKCNYRDNFDLLQTMIFISFPVWCMSAAGLYTEYYSLSVIIIATIGTGRTLRSWIKNRKSHT